MNAQQLIESGIIELYCLGLASAEEKDLVDSLAHTDESVNGEIAAVNNALAKYAATTSMKPNQELKNKILSAIEDAEQKHFPPVLTSESTIEQWVEYLNACNIHPPAEFDDIHVLDLPGTEDFHTYVVWAKHGASIPDEVHSNHDEYLLICAGECEMTIGGKNSFQHSGDFLHIEPGVEHSARVTGKEMMLVIGQRRAA